MNNEINTDRYFEFFSNIKNRVIQGRQKLILSINREVTSLYYDIGVEIIRSQQVKGWGSKIMEKISRDLRLEFPEMRSFSPQNLKCMKRFAAVYTPEEIQQQGLDKLPWAHIVTLIYSDLGKEERAFYALSAIKNGWSNNVLSMQIESKLFQRKGKAVTNFQETLPSLQSDLARDTLKNPYLFDFLGLDAEAREFEIEKALTTHIEKFLLELGEGFAFVGRQYHLEINGQDFYIDLLLYHMKLRSFVVVELKATEFKAEYVGKINLYLSAVDDLLRQPTDNPSIGLILCKSETSVLAEYALRNVSTPIGIAEYKLMKDLPENIKTSLPTIEELENELARGAKIIEEE